jgi:hypothetical protein
MEPCRGGHGFQAWLDLEAHVGALACLSVVLSPLLPSQCQLSLRKMAAGFQNHPYTTPSQPAGKSTFFFKPKEKGGNLVFRGAPAHSGEVQRGLPGGRRRRNGCRQFGHARSKCPFTPVTQDSVCGIQRPQWSLRGCGTGWRPDQPPPSLP